MLKNSFAELNKKTATVQLFQTIEEANNQIKRLSDFVKGQIKFFPVKIIFDERDGPKVGMRGFDFDAKRGQEYYIVVEDSPEEAKTWGLHSKIVGTVKGSFWQLKTAEGEDTAELHSIIEKIDATLAKKQEYDELVKSIEEEVNKIRESKIAEALKAKGLTPIVGEDLENLFNKIRSEFDKIGEGMIKHRDKIYTILKSKKEGRIPDYAKKIIPQIIDTFKKEVPEIKGMIEIMISDNKKSKMTIETILKEGDKVLKEWSEKEEGGIPVKSSIVNAGALDIIKNAINKVLNWGKEHLTKVEKISESVDKMDKVLAEAS